jgi:Domain of unknown function (DUF4412)
MPVSVSVKIVPFVAACLLTAARLGAADGVLIVQKHTSNGTTETSQTQIEKTRMRSERGIGGRPQIIIFDGTAQVIRMIDPEKKTYRELTKADVDRLGSQMSGAMAQMQEQMKNLPPEQRERMEGMMRGRGLGAAAVKTEYRRNGTDKVGKWTCDKYDGYKKEEKVTEICTVPVATLGLTPADFEITKLAAQFFQQLGPQLGEQMISIGSADQGFSGIPVKSVVTVGQRQITSEVTEVTHKTFANDDYAVPAGYQKQELPVGRRGRQH